MVRAAVLHTAVMAKRTWQQQQLSRSGRAALQWVAGTLPRPRGNDLAVSRTPARLWNGHGLPCSELPPVSCAASRYITAGGMWQPCRPHAGPGDLPHQPAPARRGVRGSREARRRRRTRRRSWLVGRVARRVSAWWWVTQAGGCACLGGKHEEDRELPTTSQKVGWGSWGGSMHVLHPYGGVLLVKAYWCTGVPVYRCTGE